MLDSLIAQSKADERMHYPCDTQDDEVEQLQKMRETAYDEKEYWEKRYARNEVSRDNILPIPHFYDCAVCYRHIPPGRSLRLVDNMEACPSFCRPDYN